MLAHVPSFGRNPRASPDFLAYPVPKACMHVLGTRVPRRWGVARSASSPKAAQALGCSLTPGLWISFGRVSCMARAASVPGLWTLGFILLCGVCVWVRLAVGCGFSSPRQSWLGSWVGVFGHSLWCCPSFAGCLWCLWLGLGFSLLMGRVWLRARSACPPTFPVPVCGVGVRAGVWASAAPRLPLGCCWGVCVLVHLSHVVSCTSLLGLLCGGACLCAGPACSLPFLAGVRCVGVRAGPGSRLCAALLRLVVGVCFLRFCFLGLSWFGFVESVAGCPCPGPCGPCPPIPFLSGLAAGSLFFFSSVVRGGFGSLLWCWRAVWWLWAVLSPPPPLLPLCFVFWGGGCLFLPLPSLGWRTHWPAFSVVFRAAVGGCVLLGRVPAPWVGWAMYKLGSALLPAGLGPGSAGWASAPGGCVWLWVRGSGLSVSFLLCGAAGNLLGGPPPLLPGA